MSESNAIEVALFPIPDLVAFPGTVLPLHVFEPRYRQLVRDCVSDHRMLAVSHTLKVIHQPVRAQTSQEALRSNQATYKPHAVFSAGYCEITDTTSDGRILATVTMIQRLTLVAEVQSLPYRIVSCAPLEDDVLSRSNDGNRGLQEAIHARLIELVGTESEILLQNLKNPAWTKLEPADYSFKVFEVLRFQADQMQRILESTSVTERLEMIAGCLGTG